MAEDLILVSADGLKELHAKLAKLPDAVADDGVQAGNEYIVTAMQQQPPPNYVTRKAAYGVTFFTERQRRWFFAALRNGEINVPYKRTQGIRNAWRIEGRGRLGFVANDAPGVGWGMGENQARQPAMVGWKKANAIIKERTAEIVRRFDAGVKKALRRIGLQ